ncbi:SDR family oxidoreductase [Rubrolithibacter danxiaensis]|uniref:SDR family oxidoreductase n=1 Tax=Rubrolithibacter danxiaensis TaxID=3390805 RepID=UPI003BF8BE06
MKIAITGATGQLGRLVVNKLKEKLLAENSVALVRSPEKAADLGVEVRKADYDHPETLEPALNGIDTLFLISASEVGKRIVQHKNIIEAAKRAGTKWIIYTSLLHADKSSLSLAEEHLATETALKEAGISFTLLRNGWYTENYTGSIAGALAGGAFVGSAGDGKIASAARVDYAEAAVAVLIREGQQGKIYELAGDTAYTLSDLAAEISRQTGKDIPYKNLSETEYAATLTGFGLPQGLAQAIASWDVSASKGDLFDDSHQLSSLIGRPTTPLATVVANALK